MELDVLFLQTQRLRLRTTRYQFRMLSLPEKLPATADILSRIPSMTSRLQYTIQLLGIEVVDCALKVLPVNLEDVRKAQGAVHSSLFPARVVTEVEVFIALGEECYGAR